MSRTTNRGRRVAIKAVVITALVLAGSLGVHFLIRAVVAMHTS
ncbi:hypothetical protein [Dactylosporangium roseum]|nr:hypothetical protein [Dactylosporangium roseum]